MILPHKARKRDADVVEQQRKEERKRDSQSSLHDECVGVRPHRERDVGH